MEKGSIIVSWSSPDGGEFDVGVNKLPYDRLSFKRR